MLIAGKNVKKLIERIKGNKDNHLKNFVVLDSDETKENYKNLGEDLGFKIYTFEEIVEAGEKNIK